VSHRISYELDALAEWKGKLCGCIWRAVVDLDGATIEATDPGGHTTHRALDAGVVSRLRTLADAARNEPATPQMEVHDMREQLDIDGFHVENHGWIGRRAASGVVHTIRTEARFPSGD
jgi:hypothetical protein